MKMEKMTDSVPKGMTEEKNPKYPKGSYVIPLVGHMPGQKGKPAEVLRAITGTFYILDFHDGNGPHKWYAEGELVKDPKVSEDELKQAGEKAKNGSAADRAKYAAMKMKM